MTDEHHYYEDLHSVIRDGLTPPWHVTPNTYQFSDEAVERLIKFNDKPRHADHLEDAQGYCLMGLLLRAQNFEPLPQPPWHKRLRRWLHRNTPLVMRRKTFEARIYDDWDY